MLAVEPVLADDPFLWALAEGEPRPLANRDFQPSGDFLCFKLLPRLRSLGSSITVWYLGGREAGPPPTSM